LVFKDRIDRPIVSLSISRENTSALFSRGSSESKRRTLFVFIRKSFIFHLLNYHEYEYDNLKNILILYEEFSNKLNMIKYQNEEIDISLFIIYWLMFSKFECFNNSHL
jgi:hypothetical protein